MGKRYTVIANLDESLYRVLARYFVLARNVVNVQDIESFLKSHHSGTEEIDRWLNTTLRKFMINKFEKVKPYAATPSDPDWMQKAQDLVEVELSQETNEKVQHLVDYLKAEIAQNPTKKFQSLQAEEAFKKSQEWLNSLLKKKTAEEVEGQDYKMLKDYGGYRWIELLSANSLAREGKLMGHCVGGYAERVKRGAVRIFSLRDSDMDPHCTIELSQGEINQIKGKQNKGVVDKYREYVLDFLNTPLVSFRKINDWDLKLNYLIKLAAGYRDVRNLPAGSVIEGDLKLEDYKGEVTLPENLTIKGDFNAPRDLESLPANFKVEGDVNFKNSRIDTIGAGFSCRNLLMVGSQLSEIPSGTSIKGDLIATESSLEKLPDNLVIGGDLDLYGCGDLTRLPRGLKVAGEIDLGGTGIEEIPADIEVGDAIFIDEGVRYPERLKDQVYE